MASQGLSLLCLALATLSFSLAMAVSPDRDIAHSAVTVRGDLDNEPIVAMSARSDGKDDDDDNDDSDDEYFYGTANSVELNVQRTLLELSDICDGLVNLPKIDKLISEICYSLDKQKVQGGEPSDWEQPVRHKRSTSRRRPSPRTHGTSSGRLRVVHRGTGTSRNRFSNSGSRRSSRPTTTISRSRTRSRTHGTGRVGHGGLPRSQIGRTGVRPGRRAIGTSGNHRRPGQSSADRGGLGHGGLPRSQNAAQGIRPGQSAFGRGSERATWNLFHSAGDNRALPFRNSVSRHGVPTTEYTRQGSYQDALQDFNSFQPANVRPWTNSQNGYSGLTGRVNGQTITVRDNSDTHGGANLDFYSRNPSNGGETLHKIRYTGAG